MNDLREAAQQALAHVQEFKRRWMAAPPFGNKVNKATREAVTLAHVPVLQIEEALRAALAEPVPHGCHVDLEEGMDPDGCVLDEGRPSKCIYARSLVREGKGKTDCEYWQPIEVKR
jgi:hypothetical protein